MSSWTVLWVTVLCAPRVQVPWLKSQKLSSSRMEPLFFTSILPKWSSRIVPRTCKGQFKLCPRQTGEHHILVIMASLRISNQFQVPCKFSFCCSREHFVITSAFVQGPVHLTNRYKAGDRVKICIELICHVVVVENVKAPTVTAAPDGPASTLQNSESPLPEESDWVALLR